MAKSTTPETISGKVRVRLPYQAQALSGRYTFLNVANAEPNLGTPVAPSSACPDPDGIRYVLLSNNSYSTTVTPPTAWRAWSVDYPRIAAYAEKSSLAFGNGQPVNNNSLVFSNYNYTTNNKYNSQTFEDNTFNVFSMSGIYLFNATTVGDPASATALIVTENGFVGINTDNPDTNLTVNGSISARNNATIVGNLAVNGNTNLGNAKTDVNIFRGEVKMADSSVPILFGDGNTSYDTNLRRGGISTLQTDSNFICNSLSAVETLSASGITMGTTHTGSFSGFSIDFNKSLDKLQVVSNFNNVSLTACSIDRNANVTGPMFPLYIPLSAFNMGTSANLITTVNYAQSGVITASELANRFAPGKGTIEMRFHLATLTSINNKKLRFEMSPDNATWTNIVDTSDHDFSSLNTYRTGIMNYGSSPNIMIFQSATTTLPDGARNPTLGTYAYTPGTAIYWRVGIGMAAGLTETMALCAGYIRVSPY